MYLYKNMTKTELKAIGFIAFCNLNGHFANAGGWELPDNPGLPEDFDDSIMNITNWLLGFVATLSVIVIIYGGMTYVASSGDQERVTSAKKSVKYAVMGLAMAGIAYAAVRLIVEQILH
ncbi:MAG: hypothetical protein WC178_00605 [Candidatus Paceibacterota bacterium]